MTYNGRRDCLDETLESLALNLSGPITRRVLVDDSGEADYPPPEGFILVAHGENLGMARTVQDAWSAALADPDIRYVLHWEDDMRLDRPLDLWLMTRVFDVCEGELPLAQLCFQRHAVNGEEAGHGGQLGARIAKSTAPQNASVTTEHHCGAKDHDTPLQFTVLDDLFSLNPCLIPRRVCEMGWPQGPIGVGNEDGFTAKCREAGLLFAMWGTVDDEPYCTHLGHERAKAWKL